MSNIMNDLHTIRLNPFAVQLLAESLLKSPIAPMTVGNPQGLFFPIDRGDCVGWCGVKITLEAVPVAGVDSSPQGVHSDDVAVDAFATAMKDKLAQARAKGRTGWQQCCKEELSQMLREHVEKGDPRDVANFCMFLHSLGHGIAQISQQEQPASVDAYVGAREDAAIWKKRALEAEELNRKFIADVNGPTYLGEPVKQEQPAERDGIPEWTPAIGIECAILNLNDNAMRLRHGSHAPLQIADDLDVIATSLAGCLPVAQQGAQS